MANLLIINADDFGLTSGVSAAILDAHHHGIVTSTSVLAVGTAFDSTIGSLRDSGLGVGGHLALIGEDRPLLSRSEIPTLVTTDGRFRPSWRQLSVHLTAGRIDTQEVRLELEAQLDRIASAGIVMTHLDTHQNVHLLPGIDSVLLDLASTHGVGAIRVPRTRRWTPVALGVRTLARRLDRSRRHQGLRAPDLFVGLDHSGHMNEARLVSAIQLAARSDVAGPEVGVHPGSATDAERDRFRWGFEWANELNALCSANVRAEIERAGLRLGTFADLGSDRPS